MEKIELRTAKMRYMLNAVTRITKMLRLQQRHFKR